MHSAVAVAIASDLHSIPPSMHEDGQLLSLFAAVGRVDDRVPSPPLNSSRANMHRLIVYTW